MEEIRTATFQLGEDKAPGPDGFNLKFYQTFWEVVQEDLCWIFQDLFDGSADTGPIDYSFVCLVLKKEGARKAGDFRPISLINGVQKIISKVLANRLRDALQEIISPSQSAFLKRRNILDSFVTASELVGWGTKYGVEGVGVKVDFEKAYDRVNWGYLRKVMGWLGANHTWCRWVEQCTSNAKIAILVNAHPTSWITAKRGVRRGDPLSPYLFFLVVEGLARMTQRALANKLLTGLGPNEENSIAIIQYANNTFFFCEAKRRQLKNLLFMWQIFEWATGLKINKSKSELFYLGATEGKGKRMAHILGCHLGTLPTRYLGLPLSCKRLSREDWRSIVSKVEKRIQGRQAKLLSQGGRLILVNSVLSNLPLYFFLVFRARSRALRWIEKLQRAFFWKGGVVAAGGHCLVQWKTVCRSKKDGGLGVKDLRISRFWRNGGGGFSRSRRTSRVP